MRSQALWTRRPGQCSGCGGSGGRDRFSRPRLRDGSSFEWRSSVETLSWSSVCNPFERCLARPVPSDLIPEATTTSDAGGQTASCLSFGSGRFFILDEDRHYL
mmetsp:Transcript_71593/g.155563  ORF Transcript_71593/g.155563 Transcript_71593/m.155563 type:complete len:103 (+) Transcript_71593:188-496(+)